MRREHLDGALDAPVADAEPAPPPTPTEGVLQLQAGAGNAAVTALIQRDGLSMRNPPSFGTPPLAGGIDLNYIEKRQREIKVKIRTYLDGEREKIQGQISVGASMAELIDRVRTNVPEAHEMAPEQIGDVLRTWSPITIAEHRKPGDVKGAESELLATARNAFSKIPTEAKLEHHGAYVKLSLGGLEAGFERDEDHSVSVGTESGKDVGVNIASGPVHFAAKLEPGEAGGPVKWEVGMTFPGDDPVPLLGSAAPPGVRRRTRSSRGSFRSPSAWPCPAEERVVCSEGRRAAHTAARPTPHRRTRRRGSGAGGTRS